MSPPAGTVGAARVNLAAVVVAGFIAFAFSLLWYSPLLFGGIWTAASGAEATAMPPLKMLVAPLRELISAYVLAWLIVHLGIANRRGAAGLALGLWCSWRARSSGTACRLCSAPCMRATGSARC